MAKLILKHKGIWLDEYPLDKPIIKIGKRNGNDIKINHKMVSRKHAIVLKVNGSYIMLDYKSTYGTYVNCKKIVQTRLDHNDEIAIGNHTLIFEDESQARGADGISALDKKAREWALLIGKELAHDTRLKMEIDKAEEIEHTASLNLVSEPGEISDIMLGKRLTIIGAGKNADIRLKGAYVPEVIAVVIKKSSGYAIACAQDRVKVKVNGRKIVRQAELADGDVIETGGLRRAFSMP